MVHRRFLSSFTKKWQFTSLVSSDLEKKHRFYEACTIVTCEVIHSEDVQFSTDEYDTKQIINTEYVIELTISLPGHNN